MLGMARRDLTALQGMGNAKVFSDEIFGFHVEQAVEKTLKAWIAGLGCEYPHTNDLGRLFALLADRGEDTEPFQALVVFTPFGVQFRYEAYDDMDELPLDRATALEAVRAMIAHVAARMAR